MDDRETLVLSFDGGIWPNPGGVPKYGWQVKDTAGTLLVEGRGEDPAAVHRTNNTAEYLGVINGLEHLKAIGWRGTLIVRGDSQVVLWQMSGRYGCRNPHLVALRDRARELLHGVAERLVIDWMPRHHNDGCDRLTRD